MKPREVMAEHSRYIDSLVDVFERELNAIIEVAVMRTHFAMAEKLAVTSGEIARSAANARILRRMDVILLRELEKAGYDLLISEFVSQFPGQAPFFHQIIESLSGAMKNPLPRVTFTALDTRAFQAQAELARESLLASVELAAARAKARALTAIGGARLRDLAESLAASMRRALPEAVGIAETATSTYYRTIAARGFEVIEQERGPLKYAYDGPLDKVTRPFCSKLVRTRRVFTRAQIDRMDNGQIPNVFVSCGGWRCRHQWLLAA